MKHQVRAFKNLRAALKALEPFVRDGRVLESGRPIPNFGKALPREVWGNWLVCAVCNFELNEERYTVTSDPTGGDGIILDRHTEEMWQTEHVIARKPKGAGGSDSEKEILKAIVSKNNKGGPAYAHGKTLVVFTNLPDGTKWYPNHILRQLPVPMHFSAIWIVSLQSHLDGGYVYGVVSLEEGEKGALAYVVMIESNFESWSVVRIQ